MGRLLAIDYGKKRCGVAVTDTLRIVATALETVATGSLNSFVVDYLKKEPVDAIVVGWPLNLNGQPSDSTRYIKPGIDRLRKLLPEGFPIIFYDERFTSSLAHQSMIDSGMTRAQRRDKSLPDRMAATIILNDFLQSRAYDQFKR